MIKIQDDPPLSCQLDMIWKDRQIRLLKHFSALSSEKLAGAEFTQGILSQFLFWLQSEPVFRKTSFEKHFGFFEFWVINWFFAKPFLFVGRTNFVFWFWGSGLIVKLYELFSKPCRDVKHLIRSVLMAVIGPELSAGDFWSTKKLPPLPHTCGPR